MKQNSCRCGNKITALDAAKGITSCARCRAKQKNSATVAGAQTLRLAQEESGADDRTIQLQQEQPGAQAATVQLPPADDTPATELTVKLEPQTEQGSGRDVTFGRYRIVKELGRGGMGIVYAARDPGLDREVALKIISLPTANARQQARFERETQLMARLNHPNIIKIFDVGQVEGRYFFTMELVSGESMSQLLRRKPSLNKLLPLFIKVVKAVDYAHQQGVIHRDLKPSNVMLDKDGEPKVMDFGLAKEREGRGEKLSRSYDILGTPEYMSPEQAEGRSSQTDARSDVYSLGIILYEILAGKTPFSGSPMNVLYQIIEKEPEPLGVYHPDVPRDMEAICFKAIDKDRNKRYQSAAALAADLERYTQGLPVLARPVTTAVRARKWVRRHWLLTMSSLAVVLMIAGFIWQQNKLRQKAEENFTEAERQKGIAVLNAKEAQQQKGIAVLNAMEAQQQKDIAVLNAVEAELSLAQAQLVYANTKIEQQCYPRAYESQQKALKALHDAAGLLEKLPARSEQQDDKTSKPQQVTRKWQVLSAACAHMRSHSLHFCAPEQEKVRMGRIEASAEFRHRIVELPFLPQYASQPSRRFVCNYKDKHIDVWDIAQAKKIQSFAMAKDSVAAFSPDHRWLALGGMQEKLLLWNIQEDKLYPFPASFDGKEYIRSLKFSPDGNWLFVSYHQRSVLLQVPELKTVLTLDEGGEVRCAFGNSSKTMAVTNERHTAATVFVFSAEQKKWLRMRTFMGSMQALCFEAGDKKLIVGGNNDIEIRPFTPDGPQEILTILRAHQGDVKGLLLSEDGKFLVSLGRDKRIVLWNAHNYRKVMETSSDDALNEMSLVALDTQRKEFFSLACNQLHIYPWESNAVRNVEWMERQEVKKATRQLRESLGRSSLARNLASDEVSMAVSPAGQYLAIYLASYIYLLDMDKGTIKSHETPMSLQYHYLAFNHDGSWLAWASRTEMRVLQIPELDLLASKKLNNKETVCLSGDSDRLVLSWHKKERRGIGFYRFDKDRLVLQNEIAGDFENMPVMSSCVSDRNGSKLGIGGKGSIKIMQIDPTPRDLFYGNVPMLGSIQALCFSEPGCIAIGNNEGDFLIYDWQKQRTLQSKNLREPVIKIWFDERERLYWIYSQNSLWIMPHLPDGGDQEIVGQIYPLPICHGYPLIAVELSADFRKVFMQLQSGELVIVPIAK